LRFVVANDSSCFFVMDLAICSEAPRSLDFGVSPRLADRPAPAAFCWDLDLAGMAISGLWGMNAQRA